jgi:hypothetical protein
MNNLVSKKKIIIAIIAALSLLILCILLIIIIAIAKGYSYKKLMTESIDIINNKNRACTLMPINLYLQPIEPTRVSGYAGRYKQKCSESEDNLYDELLIIIRWYPFSDLSETYERRRSKGGNYYKTEFSDSCVFYQTKKIEISLQCYKKKTEYSIRAYPIVNYDETEIKDQLREIHEIIWREL